MKGMEIQFFGGRKTLTGLGFEELSFLSKERRLEGPFYRERLEEFGRSSFPRSLKFSLFSLSSLNSHL